MIIFWIIAITIGLLYLFLISSFVIGWTKINPFIRQGRIRKLFISVIIPVRNESHNIVNLLNNISNQDYPSDKFEVIIVDDHSEDSTCEIIEKIKREINIRILHLGYNEHGKKSGLIKGVRESQSDLILTTDGDCRLNKTWISEMIEFYTSRSAKLIFGAVLYREGRKIFDRMQNLEFLSLVASGAGSAGIGQPILCNAANMAFDRKAYLQFAHEDNSHSVSGDDVLFLLWMKKNYPGDIHFIKSLSSIVETSPSGSLKDFINQRLRWVSKAGHYKDPFIIFTSVVVYLMSFTLLVQLAGSIFLKFLIPGFLILFFMKCFTDFVFLYLVTGYYKKRHLLKIFFPLELVYFIYISIVATAGNIFSFRWKGRKKCLKLQMPKMP